MTTSEKQPTPPAEPTNDTLDTLRHLFDTWAFQHTDTTILTEEQTHEAYVHAHDEVQPLPPEEDEA